VTGRKFDERDLQIIRAIATNDPPPSCQELMKLTGFLSSSSVFGRLEKLKDLGLIAWKEGEYGKKKRTLTVTSEGQFYADTYVTAEDASLRIHWHPPQRKLTGRLFLRVKRKKPK